MNNRATSFMVCVVLAICFIAAPVVSGQQISGPFGLRRGMTEAELLSIIGQDAVTHKKIDALGGTVMMVSRVPRPYREFQFYGLVFSKTEGLLKITAYGNEFATSEEGTELREHYSDLKAQLTNTYSMPKEADFLKSDNRAMAEPGSFMLSLLEHERVLASYWSAENGLKLKDGINDILLEAQARQLDTGILVLTYEFAGWKTYAVKADAADAGVL